MAGDDAILQDNVQSTQKSSAIPPETGIDATVAPSHGSSDGYTLVTAGVKYAAKSATQTGSTKSVKSGKSKNSFELLQSNDDEEEDMLVKEIKENQESDNTHISPILLQPIKPQQQPKSVVLKAIRDNIAHTPKPASDATPQSKSTKKKNMPPPIPGTFALDDRKLRKKPDGFNRIKKNLKQNCPSTVSLNDLAWYITTAKPCIGHIQGQVCYECNTIQKEII